MGKLYRNKESRALVELTRRGLVVQFHPAGGGFLQRLPRSQFDALYERVMRADAYQYRPALVGGDWLQESFACYLDGRRWNGWAVPQFEMKEAAQVVAKMGGRYVPERDEFVVLEGTREEERFVAETIVVGDAVSLKTYGVGAGAWCWEELS